METIDHLPKLNNSEKLLWLSLLHVLDVISLEFENSIDHKIHDMEIQKIYKNVQRLIEKVGNRDDHDIEDMEKIMEEELKNVK